MTQQALSFPDQNVYMSIYVIDMPWHLSLFLDAQL